MTRLIKQCGDRCGDVVNSMVFSRQFLYRSRKMKVVMLYRVSYMSAYDLLNLLNKLGKEIKCEACRAIYLFFATSLINAIIQESVRLYLSFDIKITLKSDFCRKTL